jgi:L-ribulose-5-phosphate 3-epimerase
MDKGQPMKISLSYWALEGGLEGTRPVKEALREVKDLGFDAIELAIAGSGVLTPQTTRAECAEIVALAREMGLEISSLASGESWAYSPTSSDAAVRRKIGEFTQGALQVAHWLGLDAYLYVPGAVEVFFLPDAEIVPYDVAYTRARAAITALVPQAEALGVALCVENVWNKLLLSPLEMRDFIDSFGSPCVGSYFDVGNVLAFGYPEQWIRILGQRIRRVHIKDYKRAVGSADGFCDLLEGDVDFAAVKAALAEIGYNSYVTAEILPYTPGGPQRTAVAMQQIFKTD